MKFSVRMRTEIVMIEDYIAEMSAAGPEQFKKNVMKDLDRRRDLYCPADETTPDVRLRHLGAG